MKKAVYCTISVTKNMSMVQQVTCLTHEVPLYMAKFPEGVSPSSSKLDGKTLKVDISHEYDRLERKHGGEKDSNTTWVQLIYGNEMLGRMKDMIGKPLDQILGFEDEEEDKIVEEKTTASPAEVVKPAGTQDNEPVDPWTELPGGEPTKTVLEDWLEDKRFEYDAALNATQLKAWANGAIRQIIVQQLKPEFPVPLDASLFGVMKAFETLAVKDD